ncbi:fimbrial protein [Pseudomonas sp. NY15372]|uniref:fimbrial protein n=1 Tax=Pseudomonas sp. NY15372 TaxID=3400356 RepID=UPI003A8382C3
MKKTLMALALGLASTSAFAVDGKGEIRFEGKILDGGTCPIDIIGAGPGAGVVSLGTNFRPTDFPSAGTASAATGFRLAINDSGAGCSIGTAKVKFTFASEDGDTGAGEYYAIKPGYGRASNIGIEILDRDNDRVKPSIQSKEFDISDTNKVIDFTARLVSTQNTVEPGLINANVSIVADIN